MVRAPRLWVAVPAIAGLASLCVVAIRWGAADAMTDSAMRDLTAWTATRSAPGLDTWLGVRADLQRAERWSPSNPQTAAVLGALHLQRSERAEYAEFALEHLARALALRPSSPYTWGSVAVAQYRLGQTGAPLEKVLLQAWQLWPSEPHTQRILAELGLAMWEEISPATQAAVRAAVGAGMRRNPLEMLEIAERHGRLAPACAHGAADRRLRETRWAAVCAQYPAS